MNLHCQTRYEGQPAARGESTYSIQPRAAELIGDAAGHPPGLGNLPSSSHSVTTFQPWRAGQFLFTDLAIVDEWRLVLDEPTELPDGTLVERVPTDSVMWLVLLSEVRPLGIR